MSRQSRSVEPLSDGLPHIFLTTIVCQVVSLACLSGCQREEQAAGREAPEPVAVMLAPATLQSVQRSIEVVGTLYGDEEALISAKVPGRVVETLADVGDRVAAGATLARIDPVDYQLARIQAQTLLMQTLAKLGLSDMPTEDFNPETTPTVQQAKLQADNATSRFGRAQKLFGQQPPLISAQDYEDSKTTAAVARSAYDVALLAARSLVAEARTREAELRLAEQKLADTTIRAPELSERQYAVSAKLVSVGEYVKDGGALYRVVVDNPIRYRAAVPERYLADVSPEQVVSVRVEAYPEVFRGAVRRISPQVDRASRTFIVEANVQNDKSLLRPGAFARGSIATRVQESVTFVPQSAVLTFAGVRKVFTVKDGKAVEHLVTIGESRDKLIEIRSGLEGAPEVVVTGVSKLAAGVPVTLLQAPTTAPAAH